MKTGKYQAKQNADFRKKEKVVKSACVQRPAAQRNRRRHGQYVNRLLCLLIVAIVVLAAIVVFATLKNPLVGVWRMDEVTVYEFYRNGEGAMVLPSAEYEFTYSVADGTLRIDFVFEGAKDAEYTFSVDGNVLTLCGGNATNQDTYIMHKEG